MSPAVAKSLAGAMAYTNGRLQPQRMQMVTVLFTDIKGFSGTSETLDAPLLMQWLNLYLQQMCNCVNSNGGVVIQYIGDSVMAAFGVPFPRENDEQYKNDAVSAVRCAISMRDAVRVLNEQNAATNLPEIVSRIGIYTGPVAAGMLGDARKTQYTIIGDTVNTAARLESFDKSQMQPSIAADGCRILVGGPTRDLLGNEFKLQEIGTAVLPGKKTKVAVFAVI
jgi:adenylate cyclase